MKANITYRKHGHDGKWEFRIRYNDPISGQRKENSRRGFKTKSEAKYAAEEVQRNIQAGYDQRSILLKDYLDFWLVEYKEGNVRKNTLTTLRQSIDLHIKPHFGEIELRAVTPALYQQFLNKIHKDKKLSRNTISKIHNAIYGAMKRAKINRTIEVNPCDDAVLPGEFKKEEIKYIDSDQIDRFLGVAYEYGYEYWIFFKLLIETGLRKGEAGALQWSDINFNEGTISINKSLDFNRKKQDEMFGSVKTSSSERTITIRKTVMDDLRFHLQWQNHNKKQINDLYRHDLNLVLCRKDGDAMPSSSLFNAFSRILKRAGIPPLPIHSLRHTHAVLMLEAGADMKYLQERLGHGSYQNCGCLFSRFQEDGEVKHRSIR